jgi:ApbE superfamily uncharacterized protein (UPF0280 family)
MKVTRKDRPAPDSYRKRCYRNMAVTSDLKSFTVRVKETDLQIHAEKPLETVTRDRILVYRGHIEGYIAQYPEFAQTLRSWPLCGPAPAIVHDMITAGTAAGVGPMAAVAGAIAQRVGNDLLAHTRQVIVENGGDVFVQTEHPVTLAIFAGTSPLSLKVGLEIDPTSHALGVCTSSATVGHSLSFGQADAVCVVSASCALADAAATAIGNRVKQAADIAPAISFGQQINGVSGIVIIIGEAIGAWGQISLVPVSGKTG